MILMKMPRILSLKIYFVWVLENKNLVENVNNQVTMLAFRHS